jgi:hypothetical protein
MAHVEKLLIFLASPADVARERRFAQEVIDDLNRTVASQKGLVLQAVAWERDAFPSYGADPQAIINAQIADMARYSLFVGILWNRLGTSTPRAASGTVEEFELAVAARAQLGRPEIWFYFREAPVTLDTGEQLEQRKRVLEFKKQVQGNGLPRSYRKPAEFRDLFRNHLLLWLGTFDPAPAAPAGRNAPAAASSSLAPEAVRPADDPAARGIHLIGRRREIAAIMSALHEPAAKRAILISGLGGMGKTALASEVVTRSRQDTYFESVVWASFKTELFIGERIAGIKPSGTTIDELIIDVGRQCVSMLEAMTREGHTAPAVAADRPGEARLEFAQLPPAERRAVVNKLLNTKRILIVLDNFETIQDSEALLDAVFDILGQGKLLITSRHWVSDDRLYSIALSGLPEEEGVEFLRKEGKERGIAAVQGADDAVLARIHSATGGAPLAMKLVAGLMGRQPVDVVLDAVKKASTADKAYELYRYIYRYSWAMLDMAARMVLVDMSVFPPLTGGTVRDVESVSQVESREFWSAMDQLVRLSLVDKGGAAGQERYFLHPLTWNFIRSDITKEEEWSQ